MKGTIVTIGDEILIGQIIDTNSAWLGNEMTMLGINVVNMLTIADNKRAIHKAMDEALAMSDLVVVTGGLGPTKDDITKKALADYVGSDMFLDHELVALIKGYFDARSIPFLEAHQAQCYMPKDAKKLKNDMGTAPGMLFEKDGKHILSMPGVPYEMKYIFSNSFMPELRRLRQGDSKIYHRTIRTVGKGETQIAERIAYILDDLPADISMSYLPSVGEVKLRLTARSHTDKKAVVDTFVERIVDRIPKLVFGYGKTTLAESLQQTMIEKGLSLSTAESCTGGFLAHRLTSVAGSSGYYMGSIIAYDYEPKKTLLKVNPTTLEKYGAVSEETVREMLAGLLERLGTDLGVAISGIAGKEEILTHKLLLTKNREKNIEYTAKAAMNALRKFVLKRY